MSWRLSQILHRFLSGDDEFSVFRKVQNRHFQEILLEKELEGRSLKSFLES